MSVNKIKFLFVVDFIILSGFFVIHAQTTVFTYQGKLIDQGAPANGQYDFEFGLYDKSTGGNQLGSVSQNVIDVEGGNYTVNLDFGDKFPGAERYIEIRYRQSGSGNSLTTLTPRKLVTSAPYAVKSSNADKAEWADSADRLNGVAASEYVQTTDARLSNARTPTPGSADYIQNRTSPQASTNFNISGSGTLAGRLTAGQVSSTAEYYLGNKPFAFQNESSVVVGTEAGANLYTYLNDRRSSFFGRFAGNKNSIGANNSFFGYSSGSNNTAGSYNSFFGLESGLNTLTGGYNTFLGFQSGLTNTYGNYSTTVGAYANVANANLWNASAFGARATVSTSNSIVLGSVSGVNGATDTVNVGIGTTAPLSRLHVVGSALFTDGATTTTRGDLNLLSSLGNADFYMQGNGNNKGINFGVWSGSLPNATLYISQFDGTTYLDRLMINSSGTIGIGTLSSVYGATRLCLNDNHEIAPCIGGSALSESNQALQKQIDAQNEIIKRQQTAIDALKMLVCQQTPSAEICQPKK